MEVVTYKCPCCDGALEFSSDEQQLVCPYCENKYTIETIKELYGENDAEEESMNWKEYTEESGSGDWNTEEKNRLKTYVCPACAAEIVAEETTGATMCVYCGNPTILSKVFEGVYRPDLIIPFKVDKKTAMEALKKHWKGKLLLPRAFKTDNKIENITGVYVPFWLFDCDTHASMRFKATRIQAWSDANYNYTKTSHYMVTREGDVAYRRVPADGSSKMEDAYMEAIEPFNYKEAVDFDMAYLAGYVADKYDVDAKGNMERINNRIENSTTQLFTSTVTNYATVVPERKNITLNHGEIKYALFPVWMLNAKYKDKVYTFAMNGQTGKFIGELPISWVKFWAWLIGVSATLTAIISCFLYL